MEDEIGAVVDLLSHPGFLTGLGIGLVAAALLLAIGVGTRGGPGGWGLVFGSTVALGLFIQFDVDPLVYVFMGAMAVVGLAGDIVIRSVGSPSAPVSIGYWSAALAASFGLASLLQVGEVGWAPFFLPIVVAGAGAGIWLLSRSDASEVVGPMVAISVAGMWVTVPETDMITVLVGAAIPFGLATLPPLRAKAWITGSLALSSLMAWLVFFEGVPREWTIAAAWATLATLPLFGILVRIRPASYNMYFMLGIHVLYVMVVTRVADITDSAIAVAASALFLAITAGLLAIVTRRLLDPAEFTS